MYVESSYKFDKRPLEELLIALKQFARDSVVVGIVGPAANQIHPTAHGRLHTWEIALLQEHGSRNNHIPARPFIKTTLMNKSLVLDTLATAARSVINKKATPFAALTKAGETFANAVRTTLLAGQPPRNADYTKDWKGHGDTLIGLTGALYDAIGFAIRKGK